MFVEPQYGLRVEQWSWLSKNMKNNDILLLRRHVIGHLLIRDLHQPQRRASDTLDAQKKWLNSTRPSNCLRRRNAVFRAWTITSSLQSDSGFSTFLCLFPIQISHRKQESDTTIFFCHKNPQAYRSSFTSITSPNYPKCHSTCALSCSSFLCGISELGHRDRPKCP